MRSQSVNNDIIKGLCESDSWFNNLIHKPDTEVLRTYEGMVQTAIKSSFGSGGRTYPNGKVFVQYHKHMVKSNDKIEFWAHIEDVYVHSNFLIELILYTLYHCDTELHMVREGNSVSIGNHYTIRKRPASFFDIYTLLKSRYQ